MFVLAQVSDLHIVEPGQSLSPDLDTAPFLTAAVEHLHRLEPAPDLVLFTGDLVNDGRPEQYAHLRELIAPLRLPYCLMPGNHDDPDALRAAFPHHAAGTTHPRCDELIETAVRLVLLDSSRGPAPGGWLDDAQLAWLEGVLDADQATPTVVALHHPPFATGIDHMDAMALDDHSAAALAAIIGRHRHVERVLCGHIHRSITTRFAGTIAMTVPSVAHAVALDLAGASPPAWTREPPMIALHVWTPEVGLVTHLQPIGTWPATAYE